MRRLVAAVIAVVVASGCATTPQGRRGAQRSAKAAVAVGAGALAIGGVAGFLHLLAPSGGCAESGCNDSLDTIGAGFAFIGVGLLVAGGVVYGSVDGAIAEDLAKERARSEADARVQVRARATAIVKQAGELARAGDCARVLELGGELYAMDPWFHQAVFAKDADVMRCLDAERARVAAWQAHVARMDAWRLYYAKRAPVTATFQQAIDRARAGDCPAVVRLERKVQDLDAEFHAAVFIRYVAIKNCLDPAGSHDQVAPGDAHPAPPAAPGPATP